MTARVPVSFAGLYATLRRGQRSTCIGLIGDSTGDGLLPGTTSPVDEWPQAFVKRLASAYPAYTLQERRWNDGNQGYDPPITWQSGTAGARAAVFSKTVAGSLQYSGAAVTTDLDVRVQVTPTTWTPTGDQTLAAKWESTGNQRSWLFLLKTTGALAFNWSTAGTTAAGEQVSSVAATTGTGFVSGQPFWARVTLQLTNGSVGVIRFYTSPDGVTYTQLGTTVTLGATTSLFGGTAPYQIGAFTSGLASPLDGRIHWVDVRAGLTSQQSVVAPLPDDWDWYSAETTVSLTGSPVLTLLNGSQSGQGVTYLDNATRRPVLHQPCGQQVVIVNTGHNDGTQSRQTWITNYAAMIANIKTLLPNVPILCLAQNPAGAGGTFAITAQGAELRAARGALLMQWAASQTGVDAYDVWPLLSPTDTLDQLHPTTGPGSGAEKWARGLYWGAHTLSELDTCFEPSVPRGLAPTPG